MLERFAEKSVKVFLLAQQHALELGKSYCGTSDILAGLFLEESEARRALILGRLDFERFGRELSLVQAGFSEADSLSGRGIMPKLERSQAKVVGLAGEEIRDQAGEEIRDQAGEEIRDQAGEEIRDQAREETRDQARAHLKKTAKEPTRDRAKFQKDQPAAESASAKQPSSELGRQPPDCQPEMLFSPKVKNLLVVAWQSARLLNQSKVSPGHLLLGIMEEPDCTAHRLLSSLNADIRELRRNLYFEFENGLQEKQSENLATAGAVESPAAWLSQDGALATSEESFTDRARHVLQLALLQSEQLSTTTVGPEVLLLALLRDDSPSVTRFLARCGITESRAWRTVIKRINAGNKRRTRSSGAPVYSPAMLRVLDEADRVASHYGAAKIGTLHLLLAILNCTEASVNEVFVGLSVDRKALLQKLDDFLATPSLHAQISSWPRGNFDSTLADSAQLDILRSGEELAVSVALDKFPLAPNTQAVLKLAARQAESFKHARIGTEHIALGLLLDGSCAAAQSLVLAGLSLPAVQFEVKQMRERVKTKNSDGILTVRAVEACGAAMDIAKFDGLKTVLPEHLLLSMLRQQASGFRQVLVRQDADPLVIRTIVDKFMSTGASAAAASSETERALYLPADIQKLSELSEASKQLLLASARQTRIYGNDRIVLESLIQAFAQLKEGIVYRTLASFGLDLPHARKDLQALLVFTGKSGPAQIRVCPYICRLLEESAKEAKKLDCAFVEPEHILLALFSDSGSFPEILLRLSIAPAALRRRLIQEIRGHSLASPGFNWPVDSAGQTATRTKLRTLRELAPARGFKLALPSGKIERVSDCAEQVFSIASCVARSRGRSCVDSEDLLVALLRSDDLLTLRFFAQGGVSENRVVEIVESLVSPAPPLADSIVTTTSLVEEVQSLSKEIAWQSAASQVGADHVLLALLLSGRGVAAFVLKEYGLNEDAVAEFYESTLRRYRSGVEPAVPIETDAVAQPRRALVDVVNLESWLGDGRGLTKSAQLAINRARVEAIKARHISVLNAHLWLGLIAQDKRIREKVKQATGLDLKEWRKLLGLFKPGALIAGEEKDLNTIELSQEAKQTLLSAFNYARLKDATATEPMISCETILLAIIEQPSSMGAFFDTHQQDRLSIRRTFGKN